MGENVSGLSLREGAEAAVRSLFTLVEDLNIPTKLRDVGVTREMFDEIVDGTMQYRQLSFNPVKIKEQDVLDILEAAY